MTTLVVRILVLWRNRLVVERRQLWLVKVRYSSRVALAQISLRERDGSTCQFLGHRGNVGNIRNELHSRQDPIQPQTLPSTPDRHSHTAMVSALVSLC